MKYFCTMKLLYIVLSFYILALSYDTCNDFTAFDSPGTFFTSLNHSRTLNDNCSCSPFCHCSCCGKPIVPSLSSSLMPPFSVFTFGFTFYKALPAEVTLTQIWRPPVHLT